MPPAGAVHIHRLIRGIVDELQEQRQLLSGRLDASLHPDAMELHSGRLDELLLAGKEVGLQIDHRLHAKCRKVVAVVLMRLGAPVVVRIDLAEVLDIDPSCARSRCGLFGGGSHDLRESGRRGEREGKQNSADMTHGAPVTKAKDVAARAPPAGVRTRSPRSACITADDREMKEDETL
jgi:hypothetical protein